MSQHLTHPMLALLLRGNFFLHISYMRTFSYTSHAGFFKKIKKSGQFLLHIPCWLHFYLRSFSYTSRAGFFFFLFFFSFFNLGSFTYTSCAGFIFIRGVSLTHLMLALFLCGEFLLHIPCWLLFFFFSFFFF